MYAIVYGLLEEAPQIIPVPASEPPHLENRSPLSLITPRISAQTYRAPQGTLNPTPSQEVPFWNQPPDLLKHPAGTLAPEPLYSPFDAIPNPTPTALAYWDQPPNLLRHPPELWANEPWNPPLYNQPGTYWWDQPPDLQKHPPELFANQTFFAPLPSFPGLTPVALGFWAEPPDLLKHPAHLDTNLPQMTFASQQANATPVVMGFWSEPPDLLRHAAHLDTNQGLMLWITPLTGSPTPKVFWWSQPPDLQRLLGTPDTNQQRLVSQQFATPVAFGFWTEPPDLLRHPTHLDTNEPRLVSQQFATPVTWWWTQPPNLLRHTPEMWANEPYLTPMGGAIGLAPTAFDFWIQAPNLLRHPPELWIDEPRVPPAPTFDNQTPQPMGWWIQQMPLPWYARHVDTQQSARTWEGGETPFEPAIWWWTQPPDFLKHPASLDTNQLTMPFAGLSPLATAAIQWWAQAPDLMRHPSHLDTNQWTLPDAALLISSRQWWTQPPDLLRHPTHLDTNESRLVSQAFAEPAVWWWVQPIDLFRHTTHLDTNQPVVSFRDLDAPVSFGFFRQPPDTPKRTPELAPAAPYIGPLPATATATGFGFWMEPQFQPPRPPDLWTAQVYESRGSDFAASSFISPPAAFLRPAALPLPGTALFPWLVVPTTLQPLLPASFLSPIVPHIASGLVLPGRESAITPKSLAFYFHSDLLKHPPELFTWQTYVGINRKFDTPDRATYWGQPQDLLRKPAGNIMQPWIRITSWRYPFIGSAFIIPRSPLKIIQTARRSTTASPPQRIRILVGTKARQRLPDLQPPIVAVTEQEYVTFDFGQILGSSYITSMVVNCLTDAGPDAVPMTRILNTPSLLPSPTTGVLSGAIIALFGNMVATNLYMLECIAQTADGQELVLEARWSCVSAP